MSISFSNATSLGDRKKLLLVEDSTTDADMVAYLLKNEYDIEWKKTLKDAIFAVQSNRFDLALLDLSLTDSFGIDTFREFRLQALGLPLIVLTGLDDEKVVAQALNEGAQDYVNKECIPQKSELLRCLKHAIEREHALSKLREIETLYKELKGTHSKELKQSCQKILLLFNSALLIASSFKDEAFGPLNPPKYRPYADQMHDTILQLLHHMQELLKAVQKIQEH